MPELARCSVLGAAAGAVLLMGTDAHVRAQDYPNRPVRFIVPYVPGGGVDFVGRTVAQKLAETWSHSVIVDNRPGGGTNIGSELVARAAPDGYTLLIGGVPNTANMTLYKKLPYDVIKDFAPVILLDTAPNILAVHPSVPAKTVRELIALAKAHRGALTYASAGIGSSNHLSGELFRTMADIDIVHVPYKGGGAAVTDLLGGQVSMYFGTTPSTMPHVRSGKLRALGVTTAKFPDLAADLVRLNVDLIVTHGLPGALAAKQATTKISIVVAAGGEPVQSGLVASLAHPGGNITGGTFFSNELAAKRIELLRDVIPRVAKVAVLIAPTDARQMKILIETMALTAKALKVENPQFTVRGTTEFEGAFAAMVKQRVGALAVPDLVNLAINPKAIADLALKHQLPSAGNIEFAEAGGMMGYGANIPEMFRRAAYFIDKIFRGTPPADLPIEQATKFDLVVNMKTAKALGIKIPQSILVRADKVIE